MAIPSPNTQGFLDPSTDPYTATLAELHERFVAQSPAHQDARARVFKALELHLELLVEAGGPAKVWIDGGFVTYKPTPLNDVDLVYLCRDDPHMGAMLRSDRILQLLTLQDVIFAAPFAAGAKRLQPVGGLVDAFLALPAAQLYWASQWSMIKGPDGKRVPGTRKGFVEVSL
jgi:hypothetical protein